MLDIRFVRENPDAVKENIRKKFQDAKLPLVDEVIALDAEYRAAIGEASDLRANRNKLSKQIGALMGQAKKDPSKAAEAEEIKKQVTAQADRLKELEAKETELQAKIQEIMYTIPQMIDPSVPIGPDDSHNVEVQRFGEPVVPDYPIPYHVDIMESFDGIDLDAAGRVSGNGFYYLLGDIARLHEAVLAYARDFMIDKGFTYVIPPFMMHGDVVKGVMSFPEMDAMMYKIEGEDLYLIGTSEHTMIGRFIDQTLDGAKLPLTLTSYSPCFRKEKGAHGIEERGIYRIHQFEKQEMIVVCKPEDSMDWYDKLWKNSVELFRSMEIPVRQLECCSGDLADLKVKSCDIEAWSPRQQKYFEVCSCSNLGDAQARRLGIRAMLGCNYFDNNVDEVLPEAEKAVALAADCDRIQIALAPHSPYTVSPENLRRGKELARKWGLHFMTHIAETQDEVRIVREKYAATPVEHLDALGMLDDKTIGAHCIHVTDSDIRTLARRGVAVSHNPQSNMKISSGVAPVEKMRAAGALVTIGTDGTCSNNDLDMFEELRTAAFLQKSATGDPVALPAYEALKLATVNGARAMGYAEGELGVIRPGALADLIVVDLQKPHLQPIHDLVSNLVYCGKASDVDTVMVDGRIVVENRRVAGVRSCMPTSLRPWNA